MAHMRAESLAFPDGLKRICQKCALAHQRATRVVSSSQGGAFLTRRCSARRCNRLQPLSDVEGGKRSCVASLEAHNARRRRLRSEQGSASDSASPAPELPSWLTDVAAWARGGGGAPDGAATTALFAVSPNAADGTTASAEQLAAVMTVVHAAQLAARLHGCTVHVKLPEAHSPDALHRELHDSLAAAASPQDAQHADVAVRRGCLLLTVDVLNAQEAHTAKAAGERLRRLAVALQDALRGAACAAGASALLAPACAGGGADVAAVRVDGGVGPPALRTASLRAMAPHLRPCLPGAAAAGPAGDGRIVAIASGGPLPAGVTLHARLGGAHLPILNERPRQLNERAGGGTLGVALPPGCRGAVLVDLERSDEAAGAAFPIAELCTLGTLLVCDTAEQAAQVQATCDAVVRAQEPGAAAALDSVLRVIGAGLRPRCPPRVRVAAALAAATLRWDALLRHLLLPYDEDGDEEAAATAGAVVLATAAHLARAPGLAAHAPTCDAVRTAAAVLWPRGAAAAGDALRLLRAERDERGHWNAACAAVAALDAARADSAQRDTAPLLAALALLLSRGLALDVDNSMVEEQPTLLRFTLAAARAVALIATRVAGWPARRAAALFTDTPEEIAHVAWRTPRCRSLVLLIAMLHLLSCVGQLLVYAEVVAAGGALPSFPAYGHRLAPGPGPRTTLSYVLHEPATRTIVDPAALPRAQVLAGARMLAATCAAVHVPVAFVVAVAAAAPPASRLGRFYARRYEPLYAALSVVDSVVALAAEVALFARTGLLVEYPVAHVTHVHVAFIALIYWAQPVRPKWMKLCGAFYWGQQVGLLTLFPGCWRNTWRGHARLWATTAMFVASLVAGPALVARVRAQYDAHLAAVAAAAADKAAAGKAD